MPYGITYGWWRTILHQVASASGTSSLRNNMSWRIWLDFCCSSIISWHAVWLLTLWIKFVLLCRKKYSFYNLLQSFSCLLPPHLYFFKAFSSKRGEEGRGGRRIFLKFNLIWWFSLQTENLGKRNFFTEVPSQSNLLVQYIFNLLFFSRAIFFFVSVLLLFNCAYCIVLVLISN